MGKLLGLAYCALLGASMYGAIGSIQDYFKTKSLENCLNCDPHIDMQHPATGFLYFIAGFLTTTIITSYYAYKEYKE